MKANKFIFTEMPDGSKLTDIKQSLHNHEGINAVRIDPQAKTVTVDYDEARYSEGDIKQFVSQTGLNINKVK